MLDVELELDQGGVRVELGLELVLGLELGPE